MGLEDRIKTFARIRLMMLASAVSPVLNTQLNFLMKTGRLGDLREPESFSEKLSWLKLNRYADDPLVRRCADKRLVRDYVEEKGLGHMLIPLIGVYKHPEDIPWEELPESFALKWNFACGFNLICRDKQKLDIPAAVKRLKKWEKTKFWLYYAEFQYKNIERYILCEQFLDHDENEGLLDYKFYCFHGRPLAVLVVARYENGDKAAMLMSPEWEVLSDIPSRYEKSIVPPRPEGLEEMLRAAEVLSRPFPFVRVDLYEHEGKALFGELTFTPGAGVGPSETDIDGKSMGELIELRDI